MSFQLLQRGKAREDLPVAVPGRQSDQTLPRTDVRHDIDEEGNTLDCPRDVDGRDLGRFVSQVPIYFNPQNPAFRLQEAGDFLSAL
jgi:hypothetical protein